MARKIRRRGMMFTSESIRGFIAGLKTQTRRIARPQPPTVDAVRQMAGDSYHWIPPDDEFPYWRPVGPVWAVCQLMDAPLKSSLSVPQMTCWYGQPGDHIWAKESYWLPPFAVDALRYDADEIPLDVRTTMNRENWQHRGPKIMKLVHARLLFEMTDLRLQPLQDITEEDARAEGIIYPLPSDGLYWSGAGTTLTDERNPAFRIERAVNGYRGAYGVRWNQLNGGTRGHAWEDNPWVWAYTLRILELKTEVRIV